MCGTVRRQLKKGLRLAPPQLIICQIIRSWSRKSLSPLRSLITLVLLLLAAMTTGCVSKPLPPTPPREALPIDLFFKTVSLPDAGSKEYQLTRNGLLTRTDDEGVLTLKKKTARRRVTVQGWHTFQEKIAPLHVEHWKAKYEHPDMVLDGYYWELRWTSEVQAIASRGSNAGPDPKKPSRTLVDEDETDSADILLSKALNDLWTQSVPTR